jgi:hypothetical protein
MNDDDRFRVLAFSVICGPDTDSAAWADAVMSLERRLYEQAEGAVPTAPFTLHVLFHAPNRFLSPDWSGVRLGRMSKRYRTLGVDVALEPTPPTDPVAAVIRWAELAVEEACQRARRRRVADDLPELREALSRLAAAGPAPVRRDATPDTRAELHEPSDDSFVRVTSSTGEDEAEPSEGFLESLLDDLLEGTETFVRLDRIGLDSGGYLLMSRAGREVDLERRDVANDPILRSRARDPDLLLEVLVAWAFQREDLPVDLAWHHGHRPGPTS